MKHRAVLLLPLALFSASCGVSTSDGESEDEDLGSAPSAEKWSSADDPALISPGLERNIGNLPLQGEASPIPWAGSYWRASQDSINYRWAGPYTSSAAQKYEWAFGGFRVEDRVSQAFGVDSIQTGRFCMDDSQCDVSQKEQCGRRPRSYMGRCIPFWYGICNGWSAAALLFPEPQHAVVANGVTFEVQDIKALLSLVSTKVNARSVSLTCRASDARGGIAYDRAGRPVAPECRDTNPGTFHIVVANYLGQKHKPIVEDRTFDDQIWNQPVRGYQVVDARIVDAGEASALLGLSGAPSYPFNSAASSFAYMKTQVSYILEASSNTNGNLASQVNTFTGHDEYEYVLELDGSSMIIGGEWIGTSKHNHPDFLWIPTSPGAASVAGGAIRYDQVKRLADASVAH